jgi:hypothetical protein
MFRIIYKDEVIHENLSHESAAEILDEFSEKYYDAEEFNLNDLILEEI